ncbi:photomixotrophic growth related protein PmgA [Synechococcus elongatus PCC 6301]|uniref:Photomixotrophic growth related protein PmgA n=1 Tax=Synechococcus sp. (strain ATCC 27144 / PCC 6301 / SAUG 1402/1) TaxID=269084 RepID=A0A0H3K587_SYNP6|nr:photomixotrophic growth related protein PmgA [Synechococcus elongatus PCC 6301]
MMSDVFSHLLITMPRSLVGRDSARNSAGIVASPIPSADGWGKEAV